MGWTSYNATFYKRGTVDRKAECDHLFDWTNPEQHKKNSVLKSAMVGSTYYAAVRIERPKEDRDEVAAVVCLTSVDMNEYCNFSYKDMDETMMPYYYKCPKSILKLLTPTDNAASNEWRQHCWEYHAKRDRITPKTTQVRVTFDKVISWPGYELQPGTPAVFEKRTYYKKRPTWFLSGTQMCLRAGKIHDAATIEIMR